ncbi:abortive infection family protein [Alteriqipengyuania sp.]|uniref:abortive infection family protein n=1 Tax=Alteriqipengyuania sp. TaxID=2800692 RepID=UPI003517030F
MKSQLRGLVAEALYPTSAYLLPAVCERYGMDAGDSNEAMSSKRSYVMRRLEKLSDGKVLEIAKNVASDFPDDQLQASIEALSDGGVVTDISRHRVARAVNGIELCNSHDLLETLRKHFPEIDRIESVYDPFESLADDIVRHAIRNDDWTNEDILEQVGFFSCSQSKLFRFLEDLLHPINREPEDQLSLAEMLNSILIHDGFALKPSKRVSGSAIYQIVEVGLSNERPSDQRISDILMSFDEIGVHDAWQKALERRRNDPAGAITSAKTLLETVCKHIIDETGGSYGNDDLPKLYATAAAALNLAPSQHSEAVFKAILGNCQSVVGNLAGIRNKLGDSHGQGKRHIRPKPRHAELAVNLAGTMAMFLVASLQEQANATIG